MPEPIEPSRTAATSEDQSAASASSDRDETSPATPRAAPAVLNFGPPAAAGEVGTLGPYRVVKELGKGGMGAVFLAFDTRLERKVALKVMLPEFAADRDAKERFLREARAAGKITHDNVVTVYDADERGGVPYMTMQFLQGYPLDEYLKQKGAPPLPHVLRIARETAAGLAAAHALGLVHRDIKPANLWLEAPNGRVKVLDFGLAKPVGSDAELTKSGAVVGTPAYMSPEQARGLKVDHRTDLFSLGSVLYRLCTGKAPFAGPNVMAVLMALGSDEPTPVRELNPGVPEALAQLIHQLLAKKPEDRPQTATEVAKRLRASLDQLLAPAASASAPDAAVPMATAADLSMSQPVVVHPVPHQPPIVVPMQITARPEDVFADLNADAGDPTQADPAADESAPARKQAERRKPAGKGGKGLLIGAGAAVLLAGVAVAVVLAMRGKKDEPVVENKQPEGGTPGGKDSKGKPPPKPVPVLPPLPAWTPPAPVPVGASPFDKLDRAAIPKEERFDWQPKELVAVVGRHERRWWGEALPQSIDFSADGKWAVFGGAGPQSDHIIQLFDCANYRTVGQYRYPETFNAICFAPDSRSLLLSTDKGPQIVGFLDGKWSVKPFAEKDNQNWGLPVISPDRKVLVMVAGPELLQVWDVTESGYTLRKTIPRKGACIGFSADGTGVYLDRQDAVGQPWEVELVSLLKGDDSVKPVLKLPATDGPLWNGTAANTRVSPDGKTLAVCEKPGESKTCILYDLTQTPAKERARFEWAGTQGGPIAFSPDSKTLNRGYTLIERMDVSVSPPRKLEVVPFAEGVIFTVSPDSRTILTCCYGQVGFFDVGGGKPVELAPLKLPIVMANAYGNRSPVLATQKGLLGVLVHRNTLGYECSAQFWDLSGPKAVPWPNEANSLRGVVIGGDSSIVSAITPDGAIAALSPQQYQHRRHKWTPTGYEQLDEVALPQLWRHHASDSGTIFVLPPQPGEPHRLWDIREPFEKARALPELDRLNIGPVAYHRERGLLATTGGGDVPLWHLAADRLVRVGAIPEPLSAISLSPDARWLVGLPHGGGDFRLYDLKGPQPKRVDQFGDLGRVTAAAFSPDARIVYSCNYFGDLRGHEVESGKLVWQAKLPGGACWLQMAPDGRHLFTHNTNGTVYVLRLPDLGMAVAAPDRAAAEWALSVGGKVRVNGEEKDITDAKDLSGMAFRLTGVFLADNKQITDANLSLLKGCGNLASLDLSGTKITDQGIANLPNGDSLKLLILGDTQVSDEGLAHFKNCKNLTGLGLYRTKLTDAGLMHFKDCKNLTQLILARTQVSDEGLAIFSGCADLKELNLSDMKVTDAGLAHFKNCKQLAILDLHDCPQITDAGLVHLNGCKNVEFARLTGTKVTATGVAKLQKALPKCKIEWDEPKK